MKFVHKISLSADARDVDFLRGIGIVAPLGFFSFSIDETDDRFLGVVNHLKRVEHVDIAKTIFTKTELSKALSLQVYAKRHVGYPNPEGGYLESTYDLSEYCPHCGLGKRQRAPFKIANLKVHSSEIFQLNWVFDEFFAPMYLWENFLKGIGVHAKPTLNSKDSSIRDDFVQLDIPDFTHLHTDGLAYELCSVCGRKKYAQITKGFSPRPVELHDGFFKSFEEFGSGSLASRAVMLSAKTYRAYVGASLKGLTFSPCAPTDYPAQGQR